MNAESLSPLFLVLSDKPHQLLSAFHRLSYLGLLGHFPWTPLHLVFIFGVSRTHQTTSIIIICGAHREGGFSRCNFVYLAYLVTSSLVH
jgi:hypothetical protein